MPCLSEKRVNSHGEGGGRGFVIIERSAHEFVKHRFPSSNPTRGSRAISGVAYIDNISMARRKEAVKRALAIAGSEPGRKGKRSTFHNSRWSRAK